MKFSTFSKPMFRVAFEDLDGDDSRLLDFLRWLRRDDVHASLRDHPLGPADVWVGWSSETYLGFSAGRVMLLSGHRFSKAELVPRASRFVRLLERHWWKSRERRFAKYFGGYRIPPEHEKLYEAHPSAYLRCAEASVLCRVEPKNMLEIGAGNAVHVAFRHLLHSDMRTTVVDLPESICVGFLLLRAMGLDAALPNETCEADILFRLPYQEIGTGFDFAFNMSSFQEMRRETVDCYLKLVRERLMTGGILQLVSLKQSRQMPDNRPESYDYRGFSRVSFVDAPFHTSLHRELPIISVCAEL